jgi:signal peptidase I
MIRRKSKALNIENQVVSTSKNKKPIEHIKPAALNLTQSSALSPQSSNPSLSNFDQVCAELLREGHGVKFCAPGDSMYPTICDGDLITVEPIKPSDVTVGDIILYRREFGVVAHRVMNIKAPEKKPSQNSNDGAQPSRSPTQSSVLSSQHYFTLRGDAAIGDDHPVHASQILGKIFMIERNGRRLDPYSLRIKLHQIARRFVSSLRRLVFSKIQSL